MAHTAYDRLRHAPQLLLISDADTQARWYYRLKQEYARSRTERRDKDYQAPTLVKVEDNKYTGLPIDFNSDGQRMYRRRILRTVIDMRNLG